MARSVRARSTSEGDHEQANGERRPSVARPRGAGGAVFEVDGRPIQFYLFTSGLGALTEGQFDALAEKIMTHGGAVVEDEEEADTIIVHFVGVETLRRKYWDSRYVWVEEAAFIQICINSGKYVENLSRPIRKGMGGQSVGATRVPFTPEDDRHLAEYLASVVPDEGEGGRGGVEIYKRLVASAQQFDHRRWANRHTMWSWRERYAKRKAIFDPVIRRMVAENPPRPDGKGLYERSRYYNPRAPRLGGSGSDDEDDVDQEAGEVVQERGESQQRGDVNIRNEQPHRRRRSEPVPPRPVDDDVDPAPRKRARHAELPQRRVSPLDRRRSLVRDSQVAIPFEVSSAEEDGDVEDADLDFDAEFGDERPRPSKEGASDGHRSLTPLSQSRQENSSVVRKARSFARQVSRHQSLRADRPGPSQVPMSSQATLVAPSQARHRPIPPSTHDGPTHVVREEEEESSQELQPVVKAAAAGASRPHERPAAPSSNTEGSMWPEEPQRRRVPVPQLKRSAAVAPDRPGKRKRIGVVSMPPVPGLFPNVVGPVNGNERAASNGAGTNGQASQQDVSRDLSHEAGPSLRTVDQDDGNHLRHHSYSQEADEDDRNVEDMLTISRGVSAASKHPFEEDDLDTDDERTRQSFLHDADSFATATNRLLGLQLPMHGADVEKPARKTPGGAQPDSAQRPSAGGPSSSRAPPATPVPPVDLGRTTSLGSETDSAMPMPGTRAREEKMRIRTQQKEVPYTPPSGTRAAQVFENLQLRNRQVSRPLRTAAR